MKEILVDALILFVVSTIFVVIADKAFSGLKDKNVKDDPLVTAINQEDFDKLKRLFDQDGAALQPEMGLKDEHGRTALMRAAYVNNNTDKHTEESDGKRAEMIPLLIEKGADVDTLDKDGWSALMWASWSGLTKVVDELLQAKADVSVVGKQGHTALTLASMRGNAKIIEMLVQAGADMAVKTGDGRMARELVNLGMAGLSDDPDDQETVAKKARFQKVIRLLEGSE